MADPSSDLNKAAALYRERNAVYKDAHKVVGAVTKVLFPDGIELKTAEDHERWHIFELMIVKLTRYAANWREGHPDSLTDLSVYAAILKSIDEEMNTVDPF